jgi:hypothetical protein
MHSKPNAIETLDSALDLLRSRVILNPRTARREYAEQLIDTIAALEALRAQLADQSPPSSPEARDE